MSLNAECFPTSAAPFPVSAELTPPNAEQIPLVTERFPNAAEPLPTDVGKIPVGDVEKMAAWWCGRSHFAADGWGDRFNTQPNHSAAPSSIVNSRRSSASHSLRDTRIAASLH